MNQPIYSAVSLSTGRESPSGRPRRGGSGSSRLLALMRSVVTVALVYVAWSQCALAAQTPVVFVPSPALAPGVTSTLTAVVPSSIEYKNGNTVQQIALNAAQLQVTVASDPVGQYYPIVVTSGNASCGGVTILGKVVGAFDMVLNDGSGSLAIGQQNFVIWVRFIAVAEDLQRVATNPGSAYVVAEAYSSGKIVNGNAEVAFDGNASVLEVHGVPAMGKAGLVLMSLLMALAAAWLMTRRLRRTPIPR